MKSPNRIKAVNQNFNEMYHSDHWMVKTEYGGKSWVCRFIKVLVHSHCEYLLHMVVDSKSFLSCSIFVIFVYTFSELQMMEDIMSGLWLRFNTLWRYWFGIWNLKAVLTFFWCLYCLLGQSQIEFYLHFLPSFLFFLTIGKIGPIIQ